MIATGGDVYGTLAVGVLMGAPSAGPDQLPHHGDWSPVPGSLVERSVPGRSAGAAGVDPLSMAGQQLQDTGPIAALGGVGQRMARCRGFIGQRSGLGDSVPDDVHVEPEALVVLSAGNSRRTSSPEMSVDQPYAAATAASRVFVCMDSHCGRVL